VEDHAAKLPKPDDEPKGKQPAEPREIEEETALEPLPVQEDDGDEAVDKKPEDKAPDAKQKPAAKPVRERALIVMFTDGSSMNLPMSDVRSFSVDGTVLRITTRNGRTRRFQMSEVASLVVD
jgi:hypothetical protein